MVFNNVKLIKDVMFPMGQLLNKITARKLMPDSVIVEMLKSLVYMLYLCRGDGVLAVHQ